MTESGTYSSLIVHYKNWILSHRLNMRKWWSHRLHSRFFSGFFESETWGGFVNYDSLLNKIGIKCTWKKILKCNNAFESQCVVVTNAVVKRLKIYKSQFYSKFVLRKEREFIFFAEFRKNIFWCALLLRLHLVQQTWRLHIKQCFGQYLLTNGTFHSISCHWFTLCLIRLSKDYNL